MYYIISFFRLQVSKKVSKFGSKKSAILIYTDQYKPWALAIGIYNISKISNLILLWTVIPKINSHLLSRFVYIYIQVCLM